MLTMISMLLGAAAVLLFDTPYWWMPVAGAIGVMGYMLVRIRDLRLP